jgi:hypothetical protein
MIFNLLGAVCLIFSFVVLYAVEAGSPGFFLSWQPTHASAIALGIFAIALGTLGKR